MLTLWGGGVFCIWLGFRAGWIRAGKKEDPREVEIKTMPRNAAVLILERRLRTWRHSRSRVSIPGSYWATRHRSWMGGRCERLAVILSRRALPLFPHGVMRHGVLLCLSKIHPMLCKLGYEKPDIYQTAITYH